LGYFLKAAQATPAWVNQLMSVRNRVVAQLGLKQHVGAFVHAACGTCSQTDRALGDACVGRHAPDFSERN
jgi:hypothetical protein